MITNVENMRKHTKKATTKQISLLAAKYIIIYINQLEFYTLAINNANMKLRKQLYLKSHQKEKLTKIYMEFQGTLNSQNSLEKEKKVGGPTLSDFKIYYKNTINKKQCGMA